MKIFLIVVLGLLILFLVTIFVITIRGMLSGFARERYSKYKMFGVNISKKSTTGRHEGYEVNVYICRIPVDYAGTVWIDYCPTFYIAEGIKIRGYKLALLQFLQDRFPEHYNKLTHRKER